MQVSRSYRSRSSEERGTSEESDQALMALERISASCSPINMSGSIFGALTSASSSLAAGGTFDLLEPGVSPALISKTVTNILRLEMTQDEILPLLHSLIDGLNDEVAASGKGCSLILCSLLENRGKLISKENVQHISDALKEGL